MRTVTRIFTDDLARKAPVIETGITYDQLIAENDEHESFAELVWQVCTIEGFYNDSDLSSDVLCIYVKGDTEESDGPRP